MDSTSRPRSRWPLVLSFGVIAVVFAGSDVVALSRAARMREEVRRTTASALLGLELSARLDHDLAAERILVAQHVLLRRTTDMDEVERRINATSTRLDATARTFATMAVLPPERALAQQLLGDLSALAQPTREVVGLSRANRDAEAMAALGRLEASFDGAATTLRRLGQASRDEVTASQRRVTDLHRDSIIQQAALAVVGIGWTLVVGMISVRLVGRREAELDRFAGLLVERNRELDAFAARVAHDLRGPLSAISMAGATLARRAPGGETLGATHQRAVARMEAIIRDLLALARATSGDESCDVAAAATAAAAELDERLQLEGARLDVTVAPARVRGSQTLWAQVITNLLDNGLKYRRAEAPAHVTLTGRVERDHYLLRVEDHGIGMTSDELGRLFQPFYRAGRAPFAPGTGLGLTIVKRVVEVAGGQVTVESVLGRGTAFSLRLPLQTHAAPAGQTRVSPFFTVVRRRYRR